MIKLALVLLIIGCFQPAFGQLSTSNKSKNKTWIIENSVPANLIRIEIQELKDSSISVLIMDRAMSSTLNHYNVSDVKKIKFRSKKKIRRNLIIGTTIGAFVGAGFGKILENVAEEPHLVSKNVVFNSGLICGVIGGAIGYGIGSIKIAIPINGQQMKYQQKRKKIAKHAF